MKDYTEVMQLLFPEDFSASSYSIVEGIQLMWDSGSRGISGLIFGFSIVFPILKLMILWLAAMRLRRDDCPGRMLKFVEKLGKFSMIDVFVISILIVTIKGLPGGSQIHAEWGLYVFAVSVVLSIFAGFILSKKVQPLDV